MNTLYELARLRQVERRTRAAQVRAVRAATRSKRAGRRPQAVQR